MNHFRPIVRGAAVVLVSMVLLTGCLQADVRYLAGDALDGRNNNTAGSVLAQDRILAALEAWTVGANTGASGRDAYKQPFGGGTNLVGVLPGTTRADEYVMIGAHYDGLGNRCIGTGPTDSICNGATDNATGAAIVLSVLRHLAFSPMRPQRSIVFAFWDAEEDGLEGSSAYVENPLVPLADTVAYVNLDIQGANLRPSARSTTFAVGAETGGRVLSKATAKAAKHTPLETEMLSLIFGQGRSDHANLVNAGVPSVFFTDATGPCYHTVDDEAGVVDFDKLRAQAGTALRLVADLARGRPTPTLTTGLPLATFDDALVVQRLLHQLLADLSTFAPADQAALLGHVATVDAVIANGPEGFDQASMFAMLLAVQDVVVNILPTGGCDGFLESGL